MRRGDSCHPLTPLLSLQSLAPGLHRQDHGMTSLPSLADWVVDARQRTLNLVADLSDEQLLGPRLSILNPLLWEIGHVAWFQEKWVLRHARGHPPLRPDADALYDSAGVAHDTRWDLSLPPRAQTLAYLESVKAGVLDELARGQPDAGLIYFVLLSVFHEDMHTEAFTYTRQTLSYRAPRLRASGACHGAAGGGAGGRGGRGGRGARPPPRAAPRARRRGPRRGAPPRPPPPPP